MVENSVDESLRAVPKWVLTWEPRAKLLAAIIYIFGVISLSTVSMALFAFSFALITALLMRISSEVLLKRYLIISPFLLLMTIPLLVSDMNHLGFASLIIIKAFTSMTVMTIILDTQTLEQFMTSLAHLHVPPLLITILLLAYRYVFLFLEDIQKMQTAAKSRFFRGGIQLKHLKTYGQLTGCLLMKSLNRSDHVYEAMASRGFSGRFQFGQAHNITKKDAIKSSCAVILIGVIIIMERFLFV